MASPPPSSAPAGPRLTTFLLTLAATRQDLPPGGKAGRVMRGPGAVGCARHFGDGMRERAGASVGPARCRPTARGLPGLPGRSRQADGDGEIARACAQDLRACQFSQSAGRLGREVRSQLFNLDGRSSTGTARASARQSAVMMAAERQRGSRRSGCPATALEASRKGYRRLQLRLRLANGATYPAGLLGM